MFSYTHLTSYEIDSTERDPSKNEEPDTIISTPFLQTRFAVSLFIQPSTEMR